MQTRLKGEKKNIEHTGKEVNKMKRALTLFMALAFLTSNIGTLFAEGVITNYEQVIHVSTNFNAFGTATRSINTTTTTTTTNDSQQGTSTTTEIQTVTSTWHGGSLRADTIQTNSATNSTNGSTSVSNFTDTYHYTNLGVLDVVSGSGTFNSSDGESGRTQTGSIARTFTLKDGQALLLSSATTGDSRDKGGSHIGTFSDTTTIAEGNYAYLGGSWVPMTTTQTSVSNSDNGGSETMTRTTTYTRDNQGVIKGMSRSATGTNIVVTGNTGPGQVSQITYTLSGYTATATFDSRLGWYISNETYDWAVSFQQTNPGHKDPVVYGTILGVVNINGVNYVQISANYVDILDGQGLQEASGEIILIQCSEEQQAQLEALTGQQVMIAGDVTGEEGSVAIIQVNAEYGGGIVADVPQAADASTLGGLYQGEAWYQGNLGVMAEIWNSIQYSWQAGMQLLGSMFSQP